MSLFSNFVRFCSSCWNLLFSKFARRANIQPWSYEVRKKYYFSSISTLFRFIPLVLSPSKDSE